MDDRATDSATDSEAGAGPDNSVMNNTAAAARVRRARLASYLTAVVLILGGGVAITAGATGWPGSAGPSAAIPVPPRANAMFVEDEEGTGADNQANILAVTAPGLVRMTNATGATTGLGEVITPSGIVVTSAAVLRNSTLRNSTRRNRAHGKAHHVTVRMAISDKAYSAKVIGTDPAADIALLQIQGDGTFRPVTVGNSRGFAAGLAETTLGNDGTPGTITLDVGNVSRMNATATMDGRRLTGLMQTSSQATSDQEAGGPLVNLSGQVVGIDVVGTGSGLRASGFALPIDRALAIARRLTGQ
jgi:S1-C subfamily serine protease